MPLCCRNVDGFYRRNESGEFSQFFWRWVWPREPPPSAPYRSSASTIRRKQSGSQRSQTLGAVPVGHPWELRDAPGVWHRVHPLGRESAQRLSRTDTSSVVDLGHEDARLHLVPLFSDSRDSHA